MEWGAQSTQPELDQQSVLRPKLVPHAQNNVRQHADLDHGPSGCLMHDQGGQEHHTGEKQRFERVVDWHQAK